MKLLNVSATDIAALKRASEIRAGTLAPADVDKLTAILRQNNVSRRELDRATRIVDKALADTAGSVHSNSIAEWHGAPVAAGSRDVERLHRALENVRGALEEADRAGLRGRMADAVDAISRRGWKMAEKLDVDEGVRVLLGRYP